MNNYRKTFLVILAASYLLFPTLVLGVCSEVEGLYEKRRELRRKYEREFYRSREMADKYRGQIKSIDQKYVSVIHKMFYEHERKEYSAFMKCCVSPNKDGYLFFVCKLIRYYRDRNADVLLRDLPVEKEKLTDFWQMDYILSDVTPRPQILAKSSFVFLFLGTIYQLATEGNAKGIDKFLAIDQFAEGSAGEYTGDAIFKLFERYPGTVINNWSIIKKYKSSIATESFKFRANTLIKEYRRLCEKDDIHASVCKEIIEFLEDKGKGR